MCSVPAFASVFRCSGPLRKESQLGYRTKRGGPESNPAGPGRDPVSGPFRPGRERVSVPERQARWSGRVSQLKAWSQAIFARTGPFSIRARHARRPHVPLKHDHGVRLAAAAWFQAGQAQQEQQHPGADDRADDADRVEAVHAGRVVFDQGPQEPADKRADDTEHYGAEDAERVTAGHEQPRDSADDEPDDQ